MKRLLCSSALVTFLLACSGDSETPSDASNRDGGQQDSSGPDPAPKRSKIDLLLMVDNSRSMLDEQQKLRQSLPQLLSVLSTGDLESGKPEGTTGLGERDFPPPQSIRVGVITPDLGSSSVQVINCDATGDDAELVSTVSDASPSSCDSWPSPFIELDVLGSTTQTQLDFAAMASCVATTGTRGCGFEQQLEATLKAITPADSDISPPFLNNDGKADINNFVREDSLLIIVLLTDEEDCSTPNVEVFNPDSSTLVVELPDEFEGKQTANYRCLYFENELFNPERYGYLLDAVEHPADLVFMAIAGFPLGATDATTILADSDMEYVPILDEATNNQIVRPRPACISTDRQQDAAPGRRYAEAAQLLEQAGASTVLQSICQADFSDAFTQMAEVAGPRIVDE